MKKTDENSNGLEVVRKEIDQLDEQIQSLISERARLAFRVRQSKNKGKGQSGYNHTCYTVSQALPNSLSRYLLRRI